MQNGQIVTSIKNWLIVLEKKGKNFEIFQKIFVSKNCYSISNIVELHKNEFYVTFGILRPTIKLFRRKRGIKSMKKQWLRRKFREKKIENEKYSLIFKENKNCSYSMGFGSIPSYCSFPLFKTHYFQSTKYFIVGCGGRLYVMKKKVEKTKVISDITNGIEVMGYLSKSNLLMVAFRNKTIKFYDISEFDDWITFKTVEASELLKQKKEQESSILRIFQIKLSKKKNYFFKLMETQKTNSFVDLKIMVKEM